jgi:hypothetical protein
MTGTTMVISLIDASEPELWLPAKLCWNSLQSGTQMATAHALGYCTLPDDCVLEKDSEQDF